MKKFKPMKAPNDEFDLNEIKYPIMASYKLDGIRCLFYKGQMLSCSLKQIVNKQLREKFEPLRAYSEKHDCILDGEIYNPHIPFQAIISCVMTQDCYDKKAIKKWEKICIENSFEMTREEALDNLKFYCFDYLDEGMLLDIYFEARIKLVSEKLYNFRDILYPVPHATFLSKEEVGKFFEQALNDGCEGLILRDPKGRYKFGRGTFKEGLIYKVKPWVTYDAQIIDVEQATIVNPEAEKKINELGRSVTSKKKDDRIFIEKASGYFVEYEGKTLVIPLGKHTDEQKEEVWKNRDKKKGKWIEYKGMTIGMKDVPRIPRFVRYREDKD